MPGEDGGGERPGLYVERTLLAWMRTALALAAGGLGAAGAAARQSGDGIGALPFVLVALCGAVLLARTSVRYWRAERAVREGGPQDVHVDVIIAWLGTLAVAVGTAVFVVITA
ncbi:hypothetical protein Skr01_25820 [Sphaerisporangium krabiense]|nr:hypothetical protein Skr01_25820 [Sphaerisporangium krabiense]